MIDSGSQLRIMVLITYAIDENIVSSDNLTSTFSNLVLSALKTHHTRNQCTLLKMHQLRETKTWKFAHDRIHKNGITKPVGYPEHG